MRRTHIGTNTVDQNDTKNIVILKVVEWLKFDKKEGDWQNKIQPCQFLNLKTRKVLITGRKRIRGA